MITPKAVQRVHRLQRFCFDNMWLKEVACREIVEHSWVKTMGLDVLTRIAVCSHDIWKWGRVYNKDFFRKTEAVKSRLESLRMKRDPAEQQHLFWKQRAKEHWWKGGDKNTKYFHNSVKMRRRRNKVTRLKNDDGEWVDSAEEVGGVMVDYFQQLFTAQDGEMEDVVSCIKGRITDADNARLICPNGEVALLACFIFFATMPSSWAQISEILNLLNFVRGEVGVAPLVWDSSLENYAQNLLLDTRNACYTDPQSNWLVTGDLLKEGRTKIMEIERVSSPFQVINFHRYST
nr:uncharacterized protein LOC109158536 [Ipomoea trifida]